jgi:beta-galactosidase
MGVLIEKVPHVLYGGDYNPEQWPEEVWKEDVRLMQEAGVNLVSLGIFSWAKLEPRPGEYDFGWLDSIMDLLHEGGVMVDLATATASPPPWLAKVHPESLPVTQDGVTLHPGARQHYCPSSAAYRERAAQLVRRIADRYKDHPALAMWHVNNEYGCHVSECYCDASAAHFREWLEERYGDLDALNEAWGTAFWSQRYSEWGEILPPRAAPTFANPTQRLDFRRFSSDALLGCFEMEKEILREATPGVPVTTNFMSFFKPVDYWKWAELEDVVSDDSYPDPADPEAHIGAAMARDLMRSLAGGGPWVLME